MEQLEVYNRVLVTEICELEILTNSYQNKFDELP